MSSERTLTVYCPTGMMNRLQVLVSGLAIAKATGRKFQMLWPRTADCNCEFSDLFSNNLPVKTVSPEDAEKQNWVDAGKIKFDPLTSKEQNLFLRTHTFLFNDGFFKNHRAIQEESMRLFDSLKPAPEVKKQVDLFFEKRLKGRPYFGAHVRRGDFARVFPEAVGGLQDYHNDIKDFLKQNPRGRVFLSTDDGAPDPKTGKRKTTGVKKEMNQRYGSRVVFTQPRTLDRARKEAIQDGLIDFLLLRRAAHLAGTSLSSFSWMAAWGHTKPMAFYPKLKRKITSAEEVKRVGYTSRDFSRLSRRK